MVDSINSSNTPLLPTAFNDPSVDKALAEQVKAGIQTRLDQMPPAEQQAFLQMTANLAPGDVSTPDKLNATLDAFAAAAGAASMPGPVAAFVGDLSKYLARAMVEMANEQKQNALNDRLAAREQARADLLDQAKQMSDAADKMQQGALTSLITSVVGGALSIVGSSISAVGSLSQLRNMGQAVKTMDSLSSEMEETTRDIGTFTKLSKGLKTQEDKDWAATELDALTVKADQQTAAQTAAQKAFDSASNKSQVYSAFGQIGSASGDMTRGVGSSQDTSAQADAKRMDAEGSRDAAEAQYDQQVADGKKQIEDAVDDMIKQVIDFLKQMKDAEAEAMRSLTRV